jgi:hypothetical protein
MASTHTSRTLVASTSRASGAGATSGTEWDNSTKYGGVIAARVTNGATGPTTGCDFVVYVGDATTVKREFSRQTAGLTNNGVYDFVVEIPPGTMFVNTEFSGNSGGSNVTVEAYAEELSSI